MSRTYRLRRDKSKVSQKFGDGHFSLHIEASDSVWRSAIVHGLYNCPCQLLGLPILEYKVTDYKWFEVTENSHRKCLRQLNIHSWMLGEDWIKPLVSEPRYKIAPMYCHEYARPGRRTGRGRSTSWRITSKKSGERSKRRAVKMLLRKFFISGDDSDL